MATVRMTDSIRREVLKNAIKAYITQNPAPLDKPELKTAIRNGILNMPIIKELADIKAKFPLTSSYYRTNSNSDSIAADFIKKVTNTKTITEVRIENGAGRHLAKIELDTPIEVISTSHYGLIVDIQMFSETEQDNITNLIESAKAEETNWDTAKQEFEKGIESLLVNCNTAKQLLEVWPAAERLLPEGIMQRMHEKATRKAAAERIRSTTNFDLNTANQVLLSSSLLGD